jgi:putative secretion ATPase (PEP-CTERM system associated)
MYTDRYGLSGQPFQLTPDARFWFDSRTHKKAMAYLGYGLAQGEGFITVTGEIGAGKSTLVAHLTANIDRDRLNAISLVSTQVEGDDMLRLVAQGLGVATGSVEKARLLDAVEQQLEKDLRAGKRTLLIVDEAQNLPVSALEELRMLSNFQVGGRALIQTVLLGQPEFRDKLAGPGLDQLRQRVIASHHLEAMGADEVESYIRHRLTRVDWQGNPEFEPAAFDAIHAYSGGIPRRINQLSHRLLLNAAVEGAETIGAAAVEAVASEMGSDSAAREERVLPLRSARAVPSIEPAPRPVVVPDPALERRIAELEAQVVEQDGMLRRALTLLVDWVETAPETAYRTHAA